MSSVSCAARTANAPIAQCHRSSVVRNSGLRVTGFALRVSCRTLRKVERDGEGRRAGGGKSVRVCVPKHKEQRMKRQRCGRQVVDVSERTCDANPSSPSTPPTRHTGTTMSAIGICRQLYPPTNSLKNHARSFCSSDRPRPAAMTHPEVKGHRGPKCVIV